MVTGSSISSRKTERVLISQSGAMRMDLLSWETRAGCFRQVYDAVKWCRSLHSAFYPHPVYLQSCREGYEKNLRLTIYEKSAEASGDGGPGKMAPVGVSTERGKFRAKSSIRKDANQRVFKIIGMIG